MVNQCIGLAEALSLEFSLKQIEAKAPWTWLPPSWWYRPLSMTAPGVLLSPPWPDVIISCGRRSVAANMAIRDASKGRVKSIHIQDPHAAKNRFDVLIVPEHDTLRGDNVIVSQGALHHVNQDKLSQAKNQFNSLFSSLPRPLIGVLVGGSNRRQSFTEQLAKDLVAKLVSSANKLGGSIILTPSRRTSSNVVSLLRSGLAKTSSYLWDGESENPYFGVLALSDVIVVTSDSVSMVTEACFTAKPVYIFDVPGGSKRLRSFNEKLIEHGFTRLLNEQIELWPGRQLSETQRVAKLVAQKIGL